MIDRIFGIVGRAGSGKDTFAEILAREHVDGRTVKRMAFADPLKTGCAEIWGVPLDAFYDREKKKKKDNFWKITPRKMAVITGTDLFRDNYDKEFWVKVMQRRLLVLQEASERYDVVVTDIRFLNDATMLCEFERCSLIYIDADHRLGPLPPDAAQSELGVYEVRRELSCTVLENNTTIENYETIVKTYLRGIGVARDNAIN